MGGATGLDYAGVLAYLRDHTKGKKNRRETFSCIQACEREQLAVWAEQRERTSNTTPNP